MLVQLNAHEARADACPSLGQQVWKAPYNSHNAALVELYSIPNHFGGGCPPLHRRNRKKQIEI